MSINSTNVLFASSLAWFPEFSTFLYSEEEKSWRRLEVIDAPIVVRSYDVAVRSNYWVASGEPLIISSLRLLAYIL